MEHTHPFPHAFVKGQLEGEAEFYSRSIGALQGFSVGFKSSEGKQLTFWLSGICTPGRRGGSAWRASRAVRVPASCTEPRRRVVPSESRGSGQPRRTGQ